MNFATEPFFWAVTESVKAAEHLVGLAGEAEDLEKAAELASISAKILSSIAEELRGELVRRKYEAGGDEA